MFTAALLMSSQMWQSQRSFRGGRNNLRQPSMQQHAVPQERADHDAYSTLGDWNTLRESQCQVP